MNILVISGAGYIGSYTCITLLEEAQTVIAADYLCNNKTKNELGWTAKRVIVEMCRDAWQFEKN